MSDQSLLTELEALLTEFYTGSSNNERKLEIGKILENFAQQMGVWKCCLQFIEKTNNQYVIMYCLNVLERFINHVWPSMDDSEKVEIRVFLLNHLIRRYKVLPVFLRNKMAKVLVDVARVDWPHSYPDFIDNMLQLLNNKDSIALGLIVLLTASEELATPREDLVTTMRRQQLRSLMLEHSSHFLSLLVSLLSNTAEKQQRTVAATPPPSPNVSPCSSLTTGGVYSRLFSASANQQTRMTIKYSALDIETEETCCLALRTLAHLFSWIPLSSSITLATLDTIFHFVSLGHMSVHDSTDTTGELGSLAMSCVNELVMQNCVPQEFGDFLLKLFEKSLLLLQQLTNAKLPLLDDRYLEKCTEFFRAFVSSHLRRIESNPHFTVMEFLTLFLKYSLKQPHLDGYYLCLDTWIIFLDHVISMSANSTVSVEKHKSVLVSLMDAILRKVQMHHNLEELQEIDNEAIDDDNETEWSSFLRQSLEVVGKVAELYPSEAFQLVLPQLEHYSSVYMNLAQFVEETREGIRILKVSGSDNCKQLYMILCDLSTTVQAMGRLSDHFTGDVFSTRLNDAQTLVTKLCVIARYSSDHHLFNLNEGPGVLLKCCTDVHTYVLGTLRVYTHWLSEYYSAMMLEPHYSQSQLLQVIMAFAEACEPVLSPGVNEIAMVASGTSLLSLVSVVRHHGFLTMAPFQRLLHKAAHGELQQLPTKVHLLILKMLSHLLVLPWPNKADADQHWDQRSAEHSKLVSAVCKNYTRTTQQVNFFTSKELQIKAMPVISETLLVLEDLVSSVMHERAKSKAIMYKSISGITDVTISLFSIYLNKLDVLLLLMKFFLTLFNALQSQIGAALVEQTTQTFMTLLTKERLEEAVLSSGSIGAQVVENFLRILILLVKDFSTIYKSFLPSILSFALRQMYPILAPRDVPDIKGVFFELLHAVMLNNWRFFFPANILSHMDEMDEPIENESEFTAIMMAFGQSFLQPDLTIFKKNIEYLESLNTKHKLYSKPQFKSVMLYQFLHLLLQVLIQQSHGLLQEEICCCMYNMAAIDFNMFHTSFMADFLQRCEGISEEQRVEIATNYKPDEDLPTFVSNIRQFSNDLHYFMICNNSSRMGTVKLN